jgi:hypothetical protein
MINLDYKLLSFKELIQIIKECQIELLQRGTTTQCYNTANASGGGRKLFL